MDEKNKIKVTKNTKQKRRKIQNKTCLLKFQNLIKTYNEKATENKDHPKAVYREPSHLIIICGNAKMSYTTENGVHVIPMGCLRD